MTWQLAEYRVDEATSLLTPALLIYPQMVDANIQATLAMAGGDPNRWRPHVKTAKVPHIIQRLLAAGIRHFKCSTTLELARLGELKAPDVLLAMPLVGAGVQRVLQLAAFYPQTRISVLVENERQLAAWLGTPVGIYLDINPGMNRTGLLPGEVGVAMNLIKAAAGQFRGLHYYDGHIADESCYDGYGELLALLNSGIVPEEIITSGTPAMPYALRYPGFQNREFTHRISAGTVVYNDLTSLGQLPEAGYRPAALVLASVVSHPAPGTVTCDAGHKSVSVDAGVPNCSVLGWPTLIAQRPSEEHLPLRAEPGEPLPGVGDLLYLLPRHVCPTVNNFDHAVFVRDGQIEQVHAVSARGHESPMATLLRLGAS